MGFREPRRQSRYGFEGKRVKETPIRKQFYLRSRACQRTTALIGRKAEALANLWNVLSLAWRGHLNFLAREGHYHLKAKQTLNVIQSRLPSTLTRNSDLTT